MDKEYRSLLRKEKALEKSTRKVVSQDKKRDKYIDAGKKMMKHKGKRGC